MKGGHNINTYGSDVEQDRVILARGKKDSRNRTLEVDHPRRRPRTTQEVQKTPNDLRYVHIFVSDQYIYTSTYAVPSDRSG